MALRQKIQGGVRVTGSVGGRDLEAQVRASLRVWCRCIAAELATGRSHRALHDSSSHADNFDYRSDIHFGALLIYRKMTVVLKT